jgi:PhnB protein
MIMTTRLNPYIGFKGNAREAVEFYQTVFGGTLKVQTFKDYGASQDPREDDLVMHALLEADNGIVLMASDAPERVDLTNGNNVSLSLSGEDEKELRGYWEALSKAATVTMPLEKAIWGDTFGMLTDKYGIQWFVNISGGQA